MKALATCLLAAVAVNNTYAQCYTISGVVQTTPLEDCVPFQDSNGAGQNYFPYEPDISLTALTGEPFCLSVTGWGNARFAGVSELTSVFVFDALGGYASTPLGFPFDPVRGDLEGFSSQAMLETRFRGLRGTLYTKDTGFITSLTSSETPGFVGQIIRVVGGDGDFAGATGQIGVAGQEVGGAPGEAAFYNGRVCLPD